MEATDAILYPRSRWTFSWSTSLMHKALRPIKMHARWKNQRYSKRSRTLRPSTPRVIIFRRVKCTKSIPRARPRQRQSLELNVRDRFCSFKTLLEQWSKGCKVDGCDTKTSETILPAAPNASKRYAQNFVMRGMLSFQMPKMTILCQGSMMMPPSW
ncbi:hypothetical protein KCU83_g437, partial [Aureobasidium melanogenum]